MKLLVLLPWLFLFHSLSGQPYFPMEHLTPKDGLSYREVNAITQDSLGFMWIATSYGLNRYDGVEWVVYKYVDGDSTSLPDNLLNWVMEDGQGNLLLGASGRIIFFDRKTEQFRFARWVRDNRHVDFYALQPFKTGKGVFLAPAVELETAKTWLLTYLGNGRFGQAVQAEGLTDKSKYTNVPAFLTGCSSNHAWYQDGVESFYCYNHSDRTFKQIYPRNFYEETGNKFFFPAKQPSNGQYLDSFQLPPSIPLSHWRDFMFDNHWNVWLRDQNGKLYKYEAQQRHLEARGEFDLSQIPKRGLFYEDKEGTLWIPLLFGIAKVKKQRRFFDAYLNDPMRWDGMPVTGREIYAMVEDHKGRIIAASGNWDFAMTDGLTISQNNTWTLSRNKMTGVGGNFIRITPQSNTATPFFWKFPAGTPDLARMFSKDNPEIKIVVDSAGFIWTNSAFLFKCNPENDSCEVYDYASEFNLNTPFIHTLGLDNRGKLWLSRGKLFSFDPVTEKFSFDSSLQKTEFKRAIRPDGDYMWANTETGLMRFHVQTHAAEYFDLFKAGTNEILSILPHKGYLWMASRKGLLRFDPGNKSLKTYLAADGLSHDIVYTVLADDDNLWMGTHMGLCRFNISTETARNYFVEDGLTHNEFNREAAVKTRSGKMYFGGMNGIIGFFPSVLDSLSKAESARLVWTGFSKIDGKTGKALSFGIHQLNSMPSVELDYGDRAFTFRYSLMSFFDPDENKYYHYLENFDNAWNYDRNNAFINYASLPPGNYILRVKAIDSHGNLSANELSIPIVVFGPWWNSWWAYGLLVAMLSALFLGYRRYEMRRLLAQAETRRLLELDAAKSRFYTNITHEFRTPLTVIMGMMDTITGHEQARDLVLRNSRQLLQLVNQLLDLSKFESGLMQLHNRQSDIIYYLNYLTESFYSIAWERGIQLAFSSDEAGLVMDFDEEKLQHIVYNLLSNALKFTPSDSGGRVTLGAQKINQSGQNWLQIEVRDTGIGIAEEKVPYIFDRFYQTDDSHTRSSEGTGIGLTLTKEFVELMGGTITVRSTPGEGSSFTILLPVKNESPLVETETVENTVAKPASPELNAPADTSSLGAARMNKHLTGEKPFLLIVEDNKDVVTYIRTLLEKDYQIEMAPNGKVGLEMALELVPDIIISDVMMPEMDGFTFTETLKTDERTSHIPIILLTAKSEEQDRLTGLRTGADAYLIKPFNKAELLVRLEKLTELRRRLQQRYAGLEVAKAATNPASPEDAFLQKLIQLVEAHLDDPEFAAAQLYTAAHMSQPQLYRKLMALTGKSPALFIRTIRLRKAAGLLRNTGMTISEIAWATGFNDPSYFSRVFHEEFGKTPGEWRN